MKALFISYRREDSEGQARALQSELSNILGPESVFMDVDSISLGRDFRGALQEYLASCECVLVLIGPGWLEARDDTGNRRLDDPGDLVRLEIATALKRSIPVTPVLLRGVRMPSPGSLPEDIRQLAYRNAFELSHSKWQSDVNEMAKRLALGGHANTSQAKPGSLVQVQSKTPEQQRDRRNQLVVLEKVKAFWIRGVLELSLTGSEPIELGMAYTLTATQDPWDNIIQRSPGSEVALPLGTPIEKVFDEANHELLVLGLPGSGKTTMLLRLAQHLVASAERDDTRPIPVVFNLSSWTEKKEPLATWLIGELNVRYNVPRAIAHAWMRTDQILPLLDGLDEVRQEDRAACVEAVNAYRGQHGLAGLVVCSRLGDYEVLSVRLKLQRAVVIQPLTAQQIDQHLTDDDGSAMLRAVIRGDEGLRDLAASPLLLSLMMVTYQGTSAEVLSAMSGAGERRAHLFATFVERMFQRRGLETPYTQAQTIRWLEWLATSMNRHGQSIFFVEQLQPEYMTSRLDRWKYAAVDRTVSGLVLGMSVWLLTDAPTDQVVWGLLGLLVGGLSAHDVVARRTATTRMSRVTRSALLGSLVGLLVVGPVSMRVYYNWPSDPRLFWLAVPGVPIYGIVCGLLFGLVGGPSVRPRHIMVVENLRWSWAKAGRGALVGGSIGFVAGALVGLVVAVAERSGEGTLRSGLAFAEAFAMFLGVGFGLGFGLTGAESQMETRAKPNQGIWRSARHAMVGGVVFGIGMMLLLVALQVVMYREGMADALEKAARVWDFGVLVAFLGMLIYGGSAWLSHFVLRFVFWSRDNMPWNYIGFLDYCAERIFLRKVGGGYIFVHRLLLEHFVSLAPREGTAVALQK